MTYNENGTEISTEWSRKKAGSTYERFATYARQYQGNGAYSALISEIPNLNHERIDNMGWYVFAVLAGVAVNLVLCFRCANCARDKGHYGATYFWICFFFGLIGYIWVATLPDLELSRRIDELERQSAGVPSRAIVKSVTTEDGKWICGKCNTANDMNYGQCKKCGAFRG